jgi:hypothetical protein
MLSRRNKKEESREKRGGAHGGYGGKRRITPYLSFVNSVPLCSPCEILVEELHKQSAWARELSVKGRGST